MNRIRRFIRLRIQRKYWISGPSPVRDETHLYPNRDLIRHEAVNCPCGPRAIVHPHEDGSTCWIQEHHSLDAREARARQ